MILFSTILPVLKDKNEMDIFDVMLSWENDHAYEKEYMNFGDIYAWKYGNTKKIPWTEVFSYDTKRHIIGIYQETDYVTDDIKRLERHYTTPSVITKLIDAGILDNIHKEPVGKDQCSDNLPKITVNNEKCAKVLAFRLKGAAYVVFDKDGKNELISDGSKRIFKLSELSDIIHNVFEFGRYGLYDNELSWSHITANKHNRTLTEKIEGLERSYQDEKDLVSAQDEEIKALEEKLVYANNQLSANSLRIQGLENKLSDDVPLIFYGEENDIYEGEIKDLILNILKKECDKMPDNTRKKDILTSILNKNEILGTGADVISQLKTGFKGYSTLSGSQRMLLETLGFKIDESGDHYKITFKEDDRYLVVLSKTSSDHREGKNFISDITRMMF